MKTNVEIEKKRWRLIDAVKKFGERHGFEFRGTRLSARELFGHALGAIAFSSFALERDTQRNLEHILEAIERDNETELAK